MSRQQTQLLVFLGALMGLSACATTPVPAVPGTPDLASILKSAGNANTSVVAITQPAASSPRQTLPEFLGIKCVYDGVCGLVNGIRNRLGMAFPGLEATPPLLAITDPANMSEDAPPAVKAAADIKAQEDAAAQKIKALRYLATIGCGGCYPDVEDALIAAMDDCTEEVRYEAVLAVRETTGISCCYCSCDACCTEKIQKKLRALATGQPCPSCSGEQSARIRRQARLALAACGPPVVSNKPEEPTPAEGPTEGPNEGPSDGAQGDTKANKAKEGPAAGITSVPPAPTTRPAMFHAPPRTTTSRPSRSVEPRMVTLADSFRMSKTGPLAVPPILSR